jgi:RNA polymerase sigma-70 factor (ECF subfamily)
VAAVDESAARELLERRDFAAVAAWVVESYGREVFAYLLSVERDREEAHDAFSALCLALCESLPQFRSECSLRTYVYMLAHRQWVNAVRGRRKRAEVHLSDGLEAVAERVRTTTVQWLQTGPRERLVKLRDSLDPADRTLLLLRLNERLSWRDIARVLCEESPGSEALDREAATLRKRFERLKSQFRRELRGHQD